MAWCYQATRHFLHQCWPRSQCEPFSGECQRISLMKSPHWFSWWPGAVRQHAIIWYNDDSDLWQMVLTLNVWGPSYLSLTRSISWLLMPWLLTSPGHQQPWYWLYRLCQINVENDIKCKYMFMFPQKNLARKGLSRGFMSSSQNHCENSFCFDFDFNVPIRPEMCTCHEN